MKSIRTIKDELLEKCRENGGTISDVEILFIFPKDVDDLTSKKFIDWFNLEREKRGKRAIKIMSTTSQNNLKKLIAKGFGFDEFLIAFNGMYADGWAESTGNDTPKHFLSMDNFIRYHEQEQDRIIEREKEAEKKAKMEQSKQLQEQIRQQQEIEERKRLDFELKQQRANAFGLFNDLVNAGATEWTGTIYDAKMISYNVALGYVDENEKKEIFKGVIEMRRRSDLRDRPTHHIAINEKYNDMLADWSKSTYEIKCICAKEVINRVLQLKSM